MNLTKEITVIAFYAILYKKIYKQEKKTCKRIQSMSKKDVGKTSICVTS